MQYTLPGPGTGPRSQDHPAWGAAVGAGLLAGLVYLLLQTFLNVYVYGESPWTFFHMAQAIAQGPGVVEPRQMFDAGGIGIALALHFALAAAYGIVAGHILDEAPARLAPPLGIGFGIVVYLVNFHGFTGAFPWFAELRGIVTLVSHAAFGLVLGVAFPRLRR